MSVTSIINYENHFRNCFNSLPSREKDGTLEQTTTPLIQCDINRSFQRPIHTIYVLFDPLSLSLILR